MHNDPILLLNPPGLDPNHRPNREGTASFGGMSPGFLYPPHTLAVILAGLREAGVRATLLDATGEGLSLEETLARIRQASPALIGAYVSWGTMEVDLSVLRALRDAFPHTPIIALGTGARYHSQAFLDAGASHMLVGDPELAFPRLVQAALPEPGPIKVRELWPEEHNYAGLLRHPQKLPRPAWDGVPWQRYGFLTLFGSRGCDDRCAYCAYVQAQGRSHRQRPPEDVVAEFVWLERTFGPRRIMARDPVFAGQRWWAMEVARGLIQAGFRTPWECETRPEHLDPFLLKKLAQAGCRTLKIGVESGSVDELVRIGRVENASHARTYLAYIPKVVRTAQTYGINVRAYVMVGLPGQTMADIQATAAYIRQLRPTFFHPRPYVAYPRVPLGPGQDAQAVQRLQGPLLEVQQELQTVYKRQHTFWRRGWRKLLLALPD